ncbi:MAG: hypothetical protein IT160_16310 [Bryobacterales bacterium]|nr:hypothetical protein [Bryobacterales bacterium]
MKRIGRGTAITLLAAAALTAATERPALADYEGKEAVVLSSDKAEFTILIDGGSIAAAILHDDPARLNPLWNPARMSREAGRPSSQSSVFGSWVCVDGFGIPSAEERAAGFPNHGEAVHRRWDVTGYGKQGNVTSLSFAVRLPLVQEELYRTFRVVDGETVLYVDSSLESHVAFDRPAVWAEHFTVGSPFLDGGGTAADMPATRARTRGYERDPAGVGHRLPPNQDFTWPMAPALVGGTVDLRIPPAAQGDWVDHSTALVDPQRRLGYVTVVNPEKRLLIGCLFRREEFPWVQNWERYQGPGQLVRGLEFSTMPFDEARRVSAERRLWNQPGYRWLPAKSRIESRYALFYIYVPQGFTRGDEIRMGQGTLTLEDRTSGKSVSIAFSRPL